MVVWFFLNNLQRQFGYIRRSVNQTRCYHEMQMWNFESPVNLFVVCRLQFHCCESIVVQMVRECGRCWCCCWPRPRLRTPPWSTESRGPRPPAHSTTSTSHSVGYPLSTIVVNNCSITNISSRNRPRSLNIC